MAMVRRRKREARTGQVTPEAVAAFRAGDWLALHRALRLPPWQPSPLDAHGECPWPPGSAGEGSWGPSLALREVLNGNG